MTTQTQATAKLVALNSEIAAIDAELQSIEAKSAPLRGQLAELVAAATGDADAVSTATAALAAALAAGDQEAITESRNRAAAASKAEAKASARETEIKALKAAIQSLNDQGQPLAKRRMEIDRLMVVATGERLQEIARTFAADHRAAVTASARAVASAMALNDIADRLGIAPNFAPQYVPVVSAAGLAGDGAINVDPFPLKKAAIETLTAQLHAEGFSRV